MSADELVAPRLYVGAVEVDDPGELTSWLAPPDAAAWLCGGDGLIGIGEAARHKPTSIADADSWWRSLVSSVVVTSELADPPLGSGVLAFGSFVFDPDNTEASSTLVVPAFVLGRRGGRTFLTHIAAEPHPGPPPLERQPVSAPSAVEVRDGSPGAIGWQAAVAETVHRIEAGGLDKVVLAREVVGRSADDLDPRWLLARLAERYDRCWTYLVDGLVGSTPELLVRRDAGRVSSRVLAGTSRRAADAAEDRARADGLWRSAKEQAEHGYSVRSVAAALSPLCTELEVPAEPHLLALPNVWHLATDVTGTARPGTSVLELLAALHPSAAICGTPTELARETIAELEQLDRGRYTGPVGWVDAAGNGEWGIALRCGQLDDTDPRQIRLYAGCGIVAGSDPVAELAESEAKLEPMLDALRG